jgi:hypothetical protein
MKKTLATLLAATAMGAAALTGAAPAKADSTGAAIASGFGGLALGTVLGGALARPAPVYGAPPVYVERRRYAPVYERCWRERRPVFDEYGDVIGYRPKRVCE